MNTVSSSCGCGFTSDHLTDSVFLCSSSSPNSVTYQALLHGTPQANVSQLIKIIEENVFKEGAAIKVQYFLLFIKHFCFVPFGTDRQCNDISSTSTELVVNTSGSTGMEVDTTSDVGFFTGIIITLVIIIIVMALALPTVWKIAQTKRKQTQQHQ